MGEINKSKSSKTKLKMEIEGVKKPTKTEMEKILIDLIRLVGEPNLNYSDLSRKYGWHRRTLHKWVENILGEVPSSELEKERAKAYHAFIGMDTELGRLKAKNRDNPKIMTTILETERKVYESKCKVWEAFGLKEKIADELNVSGFVVSWDTKQKDAEKIEG